MLTEPARDIYTLVKSMHDAYGYRPLNADVRAAAVRHGIVPTARDYHKALAELLNAGLVAKDEVTRGGLVALRPTTASEYALTPDRADRAHRAHIPVGST